MSEYIIDPVINKPDFEVEYSSKYDLGMSGMPIQYLNGLDQGTISGGITPELSGNLGYITGFGAEFDDFESLVGLGGIDDQKAVYKLFLTKLKQHLLNTRIIAMANPETVTNAGYSYGDFMENLNYLIKNFDQANSRNMALEQVAGFDASLGFFTDDEAEYDLDGLGLFRRNKAKRAARKSRRVARRTARKAKRTERRKTKGGFFKRIGTGVKSFRKAVTRNVKKAGKSVARFGKKVGKAIARYNPASVSIRGGLTVAFKTNLLRMAEKLGYGYWSEAQAKAHNLDLGEWRKYVASLNRVKKMWAGLQGKPENLKKYILQGWSKGVKKRKLPYIPESQLRGFGAVATASTAAASGFIATITGFLKKLKFSDLFKKIKAAAEKRRLAKATGNTGSKKHQRQARKALRKVKRKATSSKIKSNLKPLAKKAQTAVMSSTKNAATSKVKSVFSRLMPGLKTQTQSTPSQIPKSSVKSSALKPIPFPEQTPTTPTSTPPVIEKASAGSGGSSMLLLGGVALAGIMVMTMGKKKT
ncbi:hypothetical protein [Flexithrix dorotheae]|uniref:hypothetical protein n=1 Tax=Flexithrix dorotheae TaxID=70993 RepID=UPI00038283DE|nr:hypothetical protein [Flexithrix dorotheae]